MPRRAGGRPAARPMAAPKAAPKPASPPPPSQPAYNSQPTSYQSAPPPAQQSSGGGLMSGIMGSVAHGMAIGTGSAIAHKAVDGMFSSGGGQEAPAAAPPVAPASQPMMQPCEYQSKMFQQCISSSNGDMMPCQQYFDAMQQCKMQMQA